MRSTADVQRHLSIFIKEYKSLRLYKYKSITSNVEYQPATEGRIMDLITNDNLCLLDEYLELQQSLKNVLQVMQDILGIENYFGREIDILTALTGPDYQSSNVRDLSKAEIIAIRSAIFAYDKLKTTHSKKRRRSWMNVELDSVLKTPPVVKQQKRIDPVEQNREKSKDPSEVKLMETLEKESIVSTPVRSIAV